MSSINNASIVRKQIRIHGTLYKKLKTVCEERDLAVAALVRQILEREYYINQEYNTFKEHVLHPFTELFTLTQRNNIFPEHKAREVFITVPQNVLEYITELSVQELKKQKIEKPDNFEYLLATGSAERTSGYSSIRNYCKKQKAMEKAVLTSFILCFCEREGLLEE